MAQDERYRKAAEVISRAEKNGMRLGFYDKHDDESI